jgi:hypothetical protein
MHKCFSICLFSFLLLISFDIIAQCNDWQQAVRYEMDVDFDVKNHRYVGIQNVEYTNNSKDTLKELYFHLYMNAFQPGSAMDVRSRVISDPDPRVTNRIQNLQPSEQGFQRINAITQEESVLTYEVHGTILKVMLSKAALPGKKISLSMLYDAQVPLQIRRMGRMNAEDIHYSMAQWYPKVCHYDDKGWHTNPYIGREFYGHYGSFDVTIRIDSNYTVAATGYLQNPGEIGKGYAELVPEEKQAGEKLIWTFYANKVHDFVWAADPFYKHTTILTEDSILLRFFYRESERNMEEWAKLPAIMSASFAYIQKTFGKYPYKEYAFIMAGDGGMEYPMATLITGNRPLLSLVGVSVHELMHSWYHGVLGFNENMYYWMDEGFTSYASELVMDFLRTNEFLPSRQEPSPLFTGSYRGYYNLVKSGQEEPMSTHADHFNFNTAYGISAYSKGAIYLHQLGYVIGQENLSKTLLAFYSKCAFKHPDDNDLRRIAEKISGIELKWYNEYWVETTKTIDYSITGLESIDTRSTKIAIERTGSMPMPMDVVVTLNSGTKVLYHVPMDLMLRPKTDEKLSDEFVALPAIDWVRKDWSITVPHAEGDIQKVEIDPSLRMADVNRDDNVWPKLPQETEENDRQ